MTVRMRPPQPAMTFGELMRHLQHAGEICIYESFTDCARSRPRYDEWLAGDYVRVLDEDRGDGIARIRIEPTIKGRDARNSQDWWQRRPA